MHAFRLSPKCCCVGLQLHNMCSMPVLSQLSKRQLLPEKVRSTSRTAAVAVYDNMTCAVRVDQCAASSVLSHDAQAVAGQSC